MPISDHDRDLMKQVAAYFEGTRKAEDPDAKYRPKREDSRSVNDTASHFGITRSKVTKMLITQGVYDTPISRQARVLREQGMSIKDIADKLGVSVGTVSSNLPYEDEIHGSETPSEHAKAMRGYRAYERMQKERQEQKKTNERMEHNMSEDWRKDLDSKMSFTETDTRRARMTFEMFEDFVSRNQDEALPDAGEMDMSEFDPEKIREKLRAKKNLTPEEILDLGEFPGAMYDRNRLDLQELYGEKLPFEPTEIIRLHLELDADFSEEEKEIMHMYGGMKGDTISRDIIVPDNLPLYALHFVIQRAFGFNNSHLHRFYMNQKKVDAFTVSVKQWMQQVGVIYRSPLMSEAAEFWTDDYQGGSFKNWLRKKYTGPCVSQCRDEGIIASRKTLKHINPDEKYYVEYASYMEGMKAVPLFIRPVYYMDGTKSDPPKEDPDAKEYRVEVKKLRDLPVHLLDRVFDRSAFDLLERLGIGEVLACKNMHCMDDYQEDDGPSTYQEMLDDGMKEEIEEILADGLESPFRQPHVYSFTDELLYDYDFGDSWRIRITGSRNCTDLVESGKITQDMLDKSNIKARVTYRPVMLCRDGEMLIEDVGGPMGMAQFIKDINTLKRGETNINGMSKTEMKAWARSQGWHKDDSTDYNLL